MSDTRTQLFTQVPRSISKEWTCLEADLSGLLDGKFQDAMLESVITRVKLTIDFNPMFQSDKDEFDHNDDNTEDRLANWRSAQDSYVQLTEALQPVIKDLMVRTYKQALEQKCGRVSLLKRVRTKMYKTSSEGDFADTNLTSPATSPKIEQAASDIYPHESVTNVGKQTRVSHASTIRHGWTRPARRTSGSS
jgi:hypothetical protein